MSECYIIAKFPSNSSLAGSVVWMTTLTLIYFFYDCPRTYQFILLSKIGGEEYNELSERTVFVYITIPE